MEMSESEKVIRCLYQITNDFDKGLDHQINELLKMGLERFGLDIGILSFISDGRYQVKNVVCPDSVPLQPGAEFPYDLSYCWVTLGADGPVAMENVGETDILGNHPAYREFGLESYIGVPIRVNGHVYGTLNFTSPNPYPRKFKDIDIDSLCLMASWIEVELAREQQRDELERLNGKLEALVRTDPLTGIPNRRHLFEHIEQNINLLSRRRSQGAVVIIDLDYFKTINDKFGHLRGDDVLVEVASVLKKALRSYDFVGRYGGEEFLLWLQDIELEEVKEVCVRIQKGLATLPFDDFTITASMGVCHFTCSDSIHLEESKCVELLISQADAALYSAKAQGRDQFVISGEESLHLGWANDAFA
ncbi:sensor domain-containing diguanylate cyclase [Enterovibrio sp. ZSDZ35]|uniref:diguanylate cyclase n=1 Tax=Enterovibrio qingdaonensis TaxID=2899818 RepID=A0ABT5QS34_9GAMM|nr:sensor domain-containing diguanylate cyclase [Enterovibrio sp. ZSDZ35]MDD1783106.1 sensor domain-containing diguanylate cyclase [Enterovibrio sp. ZSDZ35]